MIFARAQGRDVAKIPTSPKNRILSTHQNWRILVEGIEA
jgi:hypothetical protein